jgi:glycosyltransferase involved in cell wall biosynthesis
MNVLLLARRLAPPGGAERSAITLAELLSEHHRTRVCGFARAGATPPEQPWIDARRMRIGDDTPLPVEAERLARYAEFFWRFRSVLEDFDPDLVLSQHEAAIVGAWGRSRHDVPHVLFCHDDSMLPVAGRGGHRITRLLNTLALPLSTRPSRYVVRNTDLVVANSHYTKDRYDRAWDRDAAVVHPFIDPDGVRVAETGEAILHVNPAPHKGIDVTLDVAEALPDRQFLVAGPSPTDCVARRIADLENVAFRGYVDDMRAVYRETKIVLMPSAGADAFGMVPVEAGLNGIPTVHSGIGGLSEAAGTDLAVSEHEPEAYVEAIEQVLSSYDEYSARAREHAEGLTAPAQFARLESILQDRLDVSLGLQ